MYGFGIMAYRSTLWSLMMGFFVLSLLAMPIILLYKHGEGYINSPSHPFAILTLGNLGYSSMQCANAPLELGDIIL